jgi:pimeloyl-ACP methyl ester carboxylesterase
MNARWIGVLTVVVVNLCTAAVGADGVSVRRGYTDSPLGQIHYYAFTPDAPSKKTPIAFFHQNPRSAVDYEPLTSDLGKDRVVLAFDTPGYGLSDLPATQPTIADFAAAMAAALKQLGYGGLRRIDAFGFHTGSLIAAELALQRSDLVRRVVLSGIPYYDDAYIKERLAMIPAVERIPEDSRLIDSHWKEIVADRTPAIPIDRAVRVFVDAVRTLDHRFLATRAVLAYPTGERLRQITQPVLIVQPHEMLLEPTRRAHREIFPKAEMVEIPGVTKDVFDLAAKEYAATMRGWLDK